MGMGLSTAMRRAGLLVSVRVGCCSLRSLGCLDSVSGRHAEDDIRDVGIVRDEQGEGGSFQGDLRVGKGYAHGRRDRARGYVGSIPSHQERILLETFSCPAPDSVVTI